MARAAVSKTAGREFEPLRSCHVSASAGIKVFLQDIFVMEKEKSASKKTGSGLTRIPGEIRGFVIDTIAEMRRCTWPGRAELAESTILVVVVIAIISLFVFGVDELARVVISLITTGRI